MTDFETSPRTCNTGVENTCEGGLRSLLDWLAVTFKNVHDPQNIIDYFCLSAEDFEESHGSKGYPFSLRYGHIAIFFGGKVDMGCHIEFTGQGIREYEEKKKESWHKIFSRLIQRNDVNITRLDLAIDDFTPIFTINQLHKKLRRGHVRSRMKRAKKIEDIDISTGNILGETLYFGRPSSDIQIRFYEKHNERKAKGKELEDGIEYWNRTEVQLRDTLAFSAAAIIAENKRPFGEVIAGILRNYVNFLTPSNDTNKARWNVCKFWKEFIGNAEKLRLSEFAPDKTIEEKEAWISNQVDKTLAMIFLAHGADMKRLEKMIIDGQEKIKDDDEKVILNYINKKEAPKIRS